MHQGREERSWSLVCRPGLTDLPPPVTEQLIQNQLFDQGVRGILQITQRKQQSGSSALNKEGSFIWLERLRLAGIWGSW